MQCEIICIGDELLIGQVVNTNAAWLGKELTGLGMEIRQVTVLPDQKEVIVDEIRKQMLRAQWIFITGGLGPTKDDVTKDALIAVFGGELVFHEGTWQHLEKMFARFGRPMAESIKTQCMLPSSARILPNQMGTAPGLLFEASHCKVCVMPGVPFEMEHIMQAQVIPLINESSTGSAIVHRTICTVGEGESVLSEKIRDIEENLPEHIGIAYLPASGRVRIRVTGSGSDKDVLAKEVTQIASAIASRMTDVVYAEEDIQLAEAIGKRLRELGRTLSVAESCTGGFLGHMITAIPNSSDYFLGGAIVYSNKLKQGLLHVRAETITRHGAVSEETVREMALGAAQAFESDYAIAITGIAGPTGGTSEKPVGTVWIGVAHKQNVVTKKYTFGKDRLRNIELSAVYAMDMLRRRMRE